MKSIFSILCLLATVGTLAARDMEVGAWTASLESEVVLVGDEMHAVVTDSLREIPANVEKVSNEALSGSNKKRKADRFYNYLGYMKSTNMYQKVYENEGVISQDMMEHIANSFRLNSDYEAAAYWYGRFIQSTNEPSHFLHYAQALQSLGRCEDATRWYRRYADKVKESKRVDFVTDCGELKAFKSNKNVFINNEAALNTEHLDFSPVLFKNKLVLTSNRPQDRLVAHTDTWTNNQFTDLFISNQKGGGGITPLRKNVNEEYHDGTATFSADGHKMFFTRNNRKGKSGDNIIKLKIYVANRDGDNWEDITELPFNDKEFNTAHPSLSLDGTRLYFASDRPGGFGGMDIYVSYLKEGTWQTPINLGPAVNSPGNEIFPFIADDNRLYYASNGHRGLGGLDIYRVTQSLEGDDYSWTERRNLGKKFNSAKDDFGYVRVGTSDTGWLTSNRDGGLGGDDIYRWEGEEDPEEEEKEEEPEPEPVVEPEPLPELEPEPLPEPEPEPIVLEKVFVLEDVYYDFDKYYIRPDAAVELDEVVALMQQYRSMKIELGSHTDARGSRQYNQRLSQNRANAAVEYIISRGIDPQRIIAKGYGESKVINQCIDGVKCTEEEHQQNRRTEIRILEFNEPNVKIRDQHTNRDWK